MAAVSAAAADLTNGQQRKAEPAEGRAITPPEPEAVNAADLRLVIERDEATGTYVYTTINRRTGEVVQRLPREQVLKMGDESDYASGRVISTTA